MNIEQRPVKPDPPKKPLISEVKHKKESQITSNDSNISIVPDHNLIKVDGGKKFFASEIDLRDVCTYFVILCLENFPVSS